MEYVVEQEVAWPDPIAKWKSMEPWDDFPDYMIPCPLDPTTIKHAYYSMDSVASTQDTSTFDSQVTKLTQVMQETPLNKTNKASNKRVKMDTYSPQTIETRVKATKQFVGFCHHHLGLEPTMEHVMKPQLVAKFWGYMKARGAKASGRVGVAHGWE